MAAHKVEIEKRIQELENRVAEDDAREATHKAAAARRYDVREACRKSSEIRVVTDDVLGEIRFGVLSFKEFADLKLNDIEDPNERVCKVIHAMLAKADPLLTFEEVESLPFDDFTILNRVLGESLPGFLRLAKQVLNSGSAQTKTRKPSA